MAIEPMNPYQQSRPGPADRSSEASSKAAEQASEPAITPTRGASSKENANRFGPDYVLDESLKPKEIVGGVPFAPVAAAQTLAALPPIHPLATEALTELSLQKMMQPRHKAK